MKKEKLKQSNVTFHEETHQYFTAEGVELSGVTSILKKYVFPDKYDGVPDDVLAAAAERGTLIHSLCEEYAINGTVGSFVPDEVAGFISVTQGINFIASEYLVSDDEHIATMIDLIDDVCNLYDIKTTATLDKEYLSWQLSIEAALFEMQNPGNKIGHLYGVWLRPDRCEIVEVKRLEDSAVEALIVAFIDGEETFVNPLKQLDGKQKEMVAKLSDVEGSIVRMEEEVKRMKDVRQQYVDFMLVEMKKRGVKTLETDNIKLTVKEAYKRTSIDTAALKKDLPEVAAKYNKEVYVKESLIIKINK